MPNFLELFFALKGSYSGAFVALWGSCALLTAVSVLAQKKTWVSQFDAIAYWTLAILMVVFAACRPIGIARDDLGYLEIYNGVCPTFSCGQWLQGSRDWGWYSLVGVLKSLWADPRVMLWLGAAGLMVKFSVIYCLARHPMLALVLFTGLFYEGLDLTAWRIALASTIFMVALWLLIEGRKTVGWLVTLSCGIFHKQALMSPLVLLGPMLQQRFIWLPLFAIPPLVLMFSGYLVDVPALLQQLGVESLTKFAIEQGLDGYIGNYSDWRVIPLVFYPLLVLCGWLAWDTFHLNKGLYGYSAAALIGSCWVLWAFASMPVAQVRFFDFLVLPVIFLAGNCRIDLWRFSGVVFVSGVFVVKYNVLHQLLIGSFTL